MTVVTPKLLVTIEPAGETYKAVFKAEIEELRKTELGRDDHVILDFGDHQVGYVKFYISSVGSPPDAPEYLRIKFGEMPVEIAEDSGEYNGSIGKGWIQEEFLHMDVLPAVIEMPRR